MRDVMGIGEAIDTIDRTEYWRELGSSTFRRYVAEAVGGTGQVETALGLAATYRLSEAYPDIASGVKKRAIRPESVMVVEPVIHPGNAAHWYAALLILRRGEVKHAVAEYERSTRSGTFLPLWLNDEQLKAVQAALKR